MLLKKILKRGGKVSGIAGISTMVLSIPVAPEKQQHNILDTRTIIFLTGLALTIIGAAAVCASSSSYVNPQENQQSSILNNNDSSMYGSNNNSNNNETQERNEPLIQSTNISMVNTSVQ